MDDIIKEVLWEIPHIRLVHLASGAYCLLVEDTMLNDFVEDHLWDDYDFYETSVDLLPHSDIPVYYNYLHAHIPVSNLIEALQQLDVNEVERIYHLNH